MRHLACDCISVCYITSSHANNSIVSTNQRVQSKRVSELLRPFGSAIQALLSAIRQLPACRSQHHPDECDNRQEKPVANSKSRRLQTTATATLDTGDGSSSTAASDRADFRIETLTLTPALKRPEARAGPPSPLQLPPLASYRQGATSMPLCCADIGTLRIPAHTVSFP